MNAERQKFKGPLGFSGFLVCSILSLGTSIGHGQTPDPYQKLANSFAGLVQDQVLTVSVGNFLYEDTDKESPFSEYLRGELERSLPQTTKFKVIPHAKLPGMLTEADAKNALFLNPGSQTQGVRIEGVQAVLRGRFYYRYPEMTVSAELAWLEGGQIQKIKVVITVTDPSARIWPDGTTWDSAAVIGGQLSLDDLREKSSKVKFRATGIAPYPTEAGLPEVMKRQTAARMAKVYAMRELMELIGFIRIDSKSTVTINKGRPELKDEVTTVIQGYISGAIFSEPKFLKDQVEVESSIELDEKFCKELKQVIR